MAVTILLIAGMIVEQTAAVMVAAMVGVCFAILIDHIVFGRPSDTMPVPESTRVPSPLQSFHTADAERPVAYGLPLL